MAVLRFELKTQTNRIVEFMKIGEEWEMLHCWPWSRSSAPRESQKKQLIVHSKIKNHCSFVNTCVLNLDL